MIARLLGSLLLAFGASLLALMCLAWGVVAMLLLPFAPEAWGRRIGRLGAKNGFRAWLAIMGSLGAWRLDLSELESLRSAGPLILAPNHPSLLDAVFIVSRLPDAVCVMKGSLLNNFLLAPAAMLARYVPNDSLLRLIARAAPELSRGGQLILFPEGTRTVGTLGAFTEAVGAVSRRTGVPVQTLVIEDPVRFLGKGWHVLRVPPFPLTYRVRLGRRFDPPADVRAFTSELERYFARELAAHAGEESVAQGGIVESVPRLRG